MDDPIKEYFLDKLQSLEVKKRLMLIRKDQLSKKMDGTGVDSDNVGASSARNLINSMQNTNHVGGGVRGDPNAKPAVNIMKIDTQVPIGVAASPMPKAPLPPTATIAAAMSNRGKGSMDHKQRQVKKAKEITYLGQLGEAVNDDKNNERANSLAKEFQETRTKNDNLIQEQLKKQNEKLLEKLRERQVNSFNKSLQKQNSFVKEGAPPKGNPLITPEHPESTDNILGGLEKH